MIKSFFLTIGLTAILLIGPCGAAYSAPAQGPSASSEKEPIACTVMEAFQDGRLGVLAVIFHQRDKADGVRLGTLLSAHSGEAMELEKSDGQRIRATVFRVKSAFGRGLVLIPASQFKIGAHDVFTLHLEENTRKN
jgi:hypothetical protein